MPCLWAWSGSSWFNVPRPVIGRLPALFRSSRWLPCGVLPAGALPLDPVGGSAPKPRPAFEKSGGKPAGKLLWISDGLCWPAAHRERRARFVCRKPKRKGLADGSFGRWKIPAARGGGGVWRPGGPRAPGPAKQKSRGRRQSLAPAFQGASRPAAAPGPLELPPPPKRQRKARPHALWGRAHQSMVGRGAATIPPPGAKPLPMPYGQRRHSSPAAGRCPRATPPAVARRPPCA